jgi:hypothetical protein
VSAQNQELEENQARLGNFIAAQNFHCAEVASNRSFDTGNISRDSVVLCFLNKAYNSQMSVERITNELKSNGARLVKKRKPGIITLDTYGFSTVEGLLRIFVVVGYIDNKVLHLHFEISTRSRAICVNRKYDLSEVDFVYLGKCLHLLQFPIDITPSSVEVSADKNCAERDRSLDQWLESHHRGYLFSNKAEFSVSDRERFEYLSWEVDYGYSKRSRPEPILSSLVREKNAELLAELLYSPNQTSAIMAMEALRYLILKGDIVLSNAMDEQFRILTHRRIRGVSYSIDGNRRNDKPTYGEISVSNEEIKRKFEEAR